MVSGTHSLHFVITRPPDKNSLMSSTRGLFT